MEFYTEFTLLSLYIVSIPIIMESDPVIQMYVGWLLVIFLCQYLIVELVVIFRIMTLQLIESAKAFI